MAFQTLNLDLPTIAEIRKQNRAQRRAAAAARSQYARSYKSALPTLQTSDWSTSQTSSNAETRRHLRPLRNRSRELYRNNGLMKRFCWMMGINIVGAEGMTLSDVFEGDDENELDGVLNEEIIRGFNEWSLPEYASTSGKMSFADQQKLAIETVARDGEVLVRKRIDVPENKFGFALQFLDVAWLDETFNTILTNGNRVLMSVELNSLDRPVAYWLTRPSSDLLYPEYGPSFQRTRVPADEMLHLFIVTEHECQARGVPHAHAVMEMFHTLHGYIDGELYKNRAAACITNYLKPPKNDEYNQFYEEGDEVRGTQRTEGYQTGATRELETAVEQILPPGWDVSFGDPNLPSGNFDPFVKSGQRYIATGVNVPYFRLAGDYEAVNFTSSRAGDNDAHDMYSYFQRWLRTGFCRSVFLSWAKEQLLRNVVPIRTVDYGRLSPDFNARGWESVQPQADATADEMEVNNFTNTRTRICARKGLDFRKVIKKRAEEERAIEAAELKKPEKTSGSNKTPQNATPETNTEEE